MEGVRVEGGGGGGGGLERKRALVSNETNKQAAFLNHFSPMFHFYIQSTENVTKPKNF